MPDEVKSTIRHEILRVYTLIPYSKMEQKVVQKQCPAPFTNDNQINIHIKNGRGTDGVEVGKLA